MAVARSRVLRAGTPHQPVRDEAVGPAGRRCRGRGAAADAVAERGEAVGELAAGVVADEVPERGHVLDDVAVGVDDGVVEPGPDGGCVHRFPPVSEGAHHGPEGRGQRTGRP